MAEQLLTVEDLAKLWQMSVKTIYHMKYKGKLPYVKIGSSLRFERAAIDEIVHRGRRPANRGIE